MAFNFPDDFQTHDMILVDTPEDLCRILEAFQCAGWTWSDGDLPLDYVPNDAIGIVIGHKSMHVIHYLPAYSINAWSSYKHVYRLSEVLPEDGFPDDDLPSIDLSKFLE